MKLENTFWDLLHDFSYPTGFIILFKSGFIFLYLILWKWMNGYKNASLGDPVIICDVPGDTWGNLTFLGISAIISSEISQNFKGRTDF